MAPDEQALPAPDGKRKLRVVRWSNGTYESTYVAVHFAGGSSGAVYEITGIRKGVTAWWKDNATIVIQSDKTYPANTRHREVRSFTDIINIEYQEG
jgi:hypothetical protein